MIAIIGKTEGNGGVNDYTRIIADRAFREVLVAKGADAEAGQGGPDRLVRRHRRRDQPARDDLRDRPRRGRRADRRAAADRRLRDERAAAARGHRPARRWSSKVAAAVKVAMERAGITDPADVHYVQTKTPLLTIDTIRDAKSPRPRRVDRGHPRVDGPLQRLHGARRRGRPRRDRHAHRRGRACTTARCTPRSPRARRASSSTGPRSSWSATRRGSAAATASATR